MATYGHAMAHCGKKHVKFRSNGEDGHVMRLDFEVMDVTKPLLAAMRIVDISHDVRFDKSWVRFYSEAGRLIRLERRVARGGRQQRPGAGFEHGRRERPDAGRGKRCCKTGGWGGHAGAGRPRAGQPSGAGREQHEFHLSRLVPGARHGSLPARWPSQVARSRRSSIARGVHRLHAPEDNRRVVGLCVAGDMAFLRVMGMDQSDIDVNTDGRPRSMRWSKIWPVCDRRRSRYEKHPEDQAPATECLSARCNLCPTS